MVLSLVDLSLRAIMNGIENGTIQHPHLLSPKLRERILDMAVAQSLTNHPNGMAIFTSVEFLNGMTSISAETCTEDNLFLQSLTTSLATNLPNGEKVGAAITKLNLKSDIFRISTVADLIGQCPNTTTLVLRVTHWNRTQEYWPLNKSENSACNRVMENMVQLSLCGWNWNRILNFEDEIINFKQLTTLKLDKCYIQEDKWHVVLDKVRPTLENLYVMDLQSDDDCWIGLDLILPFSMPQLKSLEVALVACDRHWFETCIGKCNDAFVDNLIGCPKLRKVLLMLDEKSTNEESLVRLASMNIDLQIKIRFFVRGNDKAENAAVFDSSSHFKAVRIFHERMDSFLLSIDHEWDPQFSTALEDVVDNCSNLATFFISLPRSRSDANQAEIKSKQDMKRVNVALGKFFCNSGRGLNLKDLSLEGNFDEAVMSEVFENCLNLVRLSIYRCRDLRDHHLIDWVARGGGKLTHLEIMYCENVTSEGVIPILAKSAESLLFNRVDLEDGRNQGFYSRLSWYKEILDQKWKTLVRKICPNVRFG